ncbi:MAG TPA: NAD(P)H-quinone oxidoreductase [Pyrinomonadaceae bacterium]|nr:NAD(P)H-quinone oxidoreductase [Pyrinomonadaceae bacterium]
MKAVVITHHGDPGVLEVREVPPPPLPQGDRACVRVRASALNRADILQRNGRYPAPPGFPQDIPGLEFAGEIAEVGGDVRTWQKGDRVFGITGGGAQAEYLVTPANHLAAIPSNLDWTNAAAVPEVFITAHDALFTQASLQRDETVLIHAAGSGVGTAAIQLATARGAKAFGTARSADKLDRARQFGLTKSVVIEKDPLVLVDAVAEWTDGRGVDVILDLVGAGYLEANLKALATKGRMMLVGTTSGTEATLNFGIMLSKRLTLRGTVLRGRSNEEKAAATEVFAQEVVPLLEKGIVRPLIDKVYRMEEIGEAHRRMESNLNFGKIVVVIDQG